MSPEGVDKSGIDELDVIRAKWSVTPTNWGTPPAPVKECFVSYPCRSLGPRVQHIAMPLKAVLWLLL